MEQEMKKTYKKPELKLVSMRNEETVANTCWGGHGNKLTWYYDTSGEGWVSFQISGGSCTLNLDKVTYYKNRDDEGTPVDASRLAELDAALRASGGESGNPFKGEGADFPTNPNPSWS